MILSALTPLELVKYARTAPARTELLEELINRLEDVAHMNARYCKTIDDLEIKLADTNWRNSR
jgi:hypothetical protein